MSIVQSKPQRKHQCQAEHEVDPSQWAKTSQKRPHNGIVKGTSVKGEIVEKHPAPAAPGEIGAPKKKGPNDFCDEIVNAPASRHAIQEIKEKAFELKTLSSEESGSKKKR